MRYVSTRGGMDPSSFSDVLLSGLAPDGGLVVPESVPRLSAADLDRFGRIPYREVAAAVCGLFADDVSGLDRIVAETYRHPEVFSHPEIVPVTAIGEGRWIAGLSYGPTFAFKDMALQLVGRLFDRVLGERDGRLTVLGATSGDTGSSAEYAMVGRRRVSVFMLSPQGRMSPFQAAQMYTLDEPNIVNIAVRGTFDDCQDLVKQVNADADFRARHRLGAVNSINWARVMAQVAYHVFASCRVAAATGNPVDMVVPTGNFGNVYAGHVARVMGAPIERLVVATNENDVLAEFFATGRYAVRSDVVATSSPSMDISKASNFERYVYDLAGGDAHRVRDLFGSLSSTGGFDLSGTPERAAVAATGFVAGSSTQQQRIDTIRRLHAEQGLLVDPHTADGIAVGQELRRPGVPMVFLETAQPLKFAATIEEAVGFPPPLPPGVADMLERPQHHETVDVDADQVKQIIRSSSQ